MKYRYTATVKEDDKLRESFNELTRILSQIWF